jgi:uncharacterized protein
MPKPRRKSAARGRRRRAPRPKAVPAQERSTGPAQTLRARITLLEDKVDELEKANEELSRERTALRERAGVIEKRYTELMERTARTEQAEAAPRSAPELQSLRRSLDESRREREEASGKKRFWMTCPRCGGKLEEIEHENVKVDRCSACAGIYLDKGELEAIVSSKSAGGVFRSLRELFS